MIEIDVRTVLLSHVLTNMICTLILFLLWRNNRKRFMGISLWAANFAFQTIGLLLIGLRGFVPEFISIIVANTMLIIGGLLGLLGLERFIERKMPHIHLYLLVAVFIAVEINFTYFDPRLSMRILNHSVLIMIICFQCAWLLLRESRPGIRWVSALTGFVYSMFCAVSAARILISFRYPGASNDFFESASTDSLFLIFYQMLFISLTYSLSLMVNKSLLRDVILQEEKFFKAFHSSPSGMILVSFPDGLILEINETFEKTTGFRQHEAIGRSTSELRLWSGDDDLEKVMILLRGSGKAQHLEMKFRKKNGEMLTGLLSADIITINDRPTVVASISDITSMKQAEERVRQVLAEKEILMKEIHHRVKNNMAAVSGMLNIQAMRAGDDRLREILTDCVNRVNSMQGVYETLFRTDNLTEVNVEYYLGNLATSLFRSYNVRNDKIRLELDVQDVKIPVEKAIPCGFIINELVTNSLKYAFPGDASGMISISLFPDPGSAGPAEVSGAIGQRRFRLSIADDGVGLPAGMDASQSTGFGLQLVQMLVNQLNGSMEIISINGTEFRICFSA
ncbi:MAG TPA: histidine kinase dimerization/phosphoacceptor domain -containing protein [Spirochaetota bacterium]|nr:histidine kinase dimerization/phosphoacceptor domain -containing protein [Spirochaetota bacterium]HRZ26983.1 histidine kinase dimerization/phosphoacceptor domain -containing protein [Spirochaetota bacterium]HSA16008.1 histidine kinase dimerization/phosphoacceptor domain -containing protein [Spirochaetota bacterium]